MQDFTGTTWGRFQIIEERGRGGMAVVYKAYDDTLQRTVALKVLLPVLAANEEFTRRFRREAITAANLRHPNIVVIYDVGSHNSFQYIVMEYLEGPTLQQEIQQGGAMSLKRTMAILRQLAEALDYAHRQGLVHRDVKPANVIIGARDRATLTDFGLVTAARRGKITGEGVAIGTLNYMSPEQATGKDVDSRSDIYSLGVVTYEMLAGDAPFRGTTPYETLRDLIHKSPPPLSKKNSQIPAGVELAVSTALAKDPSRRFGTAGQFAEALATAAGLGIPVRRQYETEALNRRVVLLLIDADGREYPVYRGHTTIGRDATNDLVVAQRQVSRHHARFECRTGGCTVVDLDSTNGTSINGVHLAPRQPHPLSAEDVLSLGPVELLVTLPSDRREPQTISMERKPD